MASLVESLVVVLEDEERIYRKLTKYGEQKTQALIDAKIDKLEEITDKEQNASDKLLILSNKQLQLLKDISVVLGCDGETMTVTNVINHLDSKEEVKGKLSEAKTRLLKSAGEMNSVNEQNKVLLKQAMELAEFDITLFRSLRQAPQTANYNNHAYSTGTLLPSSGFDAKQ